MNDGKRMTTGLLVRSAHVFGHIPGIPVGTHWDSRQACSLDRVHRPVVAGIHGTKDEGAYSIALSGQYPDDEDNGDTFIYTGAGGREHEGNARDTWLRVGPQKTNQTWDGWGNRSLLVSMETQLPIRVIRSARLPSMYAPTAGMYRYDGLYVVTRAWQEKGKEQKLVCRYQLERLPGQPPLGINPLSFDVFDEPLQVVPMERIPQRHSLPSRTEHEDRRNEESATEENVVSATTASAAASSSSVNVKPFNILSTLKFTKVRSVSG